MCHGQQKPCKSQPALEETHRFCCAQASFPPTHLLPVGSRSQPAFEETGSCTDFAACEPASWRGYGRAGATERHRPCMMGCPPPHPHGYWGGHRLGFPSLGLQAEPPPRLNHFGLTCPCHFWVVLGTAPCMPASTRRDSSMPGNVLASLLVDAGTLGEAPDATQKW